jgi:hypothetical protein
MDNEKRVSQEKDDDESKRRSGRTSREPARRKRDSRDIWDLELRCVRCQQELYVEDNVIDEVFESMRTAGGVVLICTCGQPQIVRDPRWRPRYHD